MTQEGKIITQLVNRILFRGEWGIKKRGRLITFKSKK